MDPGEMKVIIISTVVIGIFLGGDFCFTRKKYSFKSETFKQYVPLLPVLVTILITHLQALKQDRI